MIMASRTLQMNKISTSNDVSRVQYIEYICTPIINSSPSIFQFHTSLPPKGSIELILDIAFTCKLKLNGRTT